ncbi:ERI1 exoribonuclease 2 [Platichthys flesus]|uniref:ERI1 exoribonuclease 2 n=1 Tax=Platichthys flesus TaxID=8260 RepID=UPI002DC010B3|nr:ERI1 exoribonuclease 2 [Platichthys flesus]
MSIFEKSSALFVVFSEVVTVEMISSFHAKSSFNDRKPTGSRVDAAEMSTRKLAKQLGLLRQRSQSSSGSKKALVSNQMFSYLIVIDFESTCWREKSSYSPEVIEFPAVLLNTSSGEVESEFHTYVQPQEHPTLSEFCTELTGITQIQVEAGIPLRICLSRFCRWLHNLQLEKGVVFPNKQQNISPPSPKLCTFLTWSDWDLGVCLQYECKRKQLHKPDVLNSWIDLRSTYRLFYDRKPKGLNGALQDLGIQFAGREHSGLDDSRNTAQLAARMMRDGCVMKITRSLERTPSTVKPVFGKVTTDKKKEKPNPNNKENTLTTNKSSSSKIPLTSCQIKTCSEKNAVKSDTMENASSVQESVQSLISPKTLLNGTNTPLWGCGRRSVTSGAVADRSSSVTINMSSPHSNGNNTLLLCSTTLGCLSDLPHTDQPFKSGGAVAPVEDEEGGELSVETEERWGSYDDVVFEADDETDGERVSDYDSGCYESEESENTSDLKEGQVTSRDNTSAENSSRTTHSSTTFVSAKNTRVDQLNVTRQHSVISGPDTCFAVPETVSWFSKNKLAQLNSVLFQKNLDKAPNKTNTPSLLRHKALVPGKTSTPNASFVKPKQVIMQNRNHKTPRTSFSIFTDLVQQAAASHPSSCSSLFTPKNVLSSLSANTNSSSINRSSMSVTLKKGQQITSPLCGCGRRAKRQLVSNGGPNHGRGFYCCQVRRSGSGGRVRKGCEFFKWESSLMSRSSVASPAARASVSLCSTLNRPPQQSATIRKSY